MLQSLNPGLAINPSADQASFFESINPNQAYTVVNLHIYHTVAHYPDTAEKMDTPLTGQQAYQKYLHLINDEIIPHIQGAKIVRLPVDAIIIGENPWQEVVIGCYDNRNAMFALNEHPFYSIAAPHREAALKMVNSFVISGNFLTQYSS